MIISLSEDKFYVFFLSHSFSQLVNNSDAQQQYASHTKQTHTSNVFVLLILSVLNGRNKLTSLPLADHNHFLIENMFKFPGLYHSVTSFMMKTRFSRVQFEWIVNEKLHSVL